MARTIRGWITVKGQHIPLMEGESNRQAIKKFLDKKSSKGRTIKNKEYANELGNNLNVINKYAKSYRDARFAELSSNDEVLQSLIAKAVGVKDYKAVKDEEETTKDWQRLKNDASYNLRKEETKLYRLKNEVIEKAIKQGAEPERLSYV